LAGVSIGRRGTPSASAAASAGSPLWIILLLVVFVALATLYAGLAPPFEGPDSGAHFRAVAYLRQHEGLPSINSETAGISHELILQPPLYYALTALLTPTQALAPAQGLEVLNPYYRLGLSHRVTISVPGEPSTAFALWLARFVAMAGGLLTVLGTWLLVRELLPGSPGIALAAAAVVGLNPMYLFTSASITNDTWPAGMAAITLWLALRCVHRDERRPLPWLGVGALAGLGALTKYSNLLVAVPLALIMLPFLWKLRWRVGLRLGLVALAGALLTGGFWYARNLALYGNLMPMDRMLAVLPGIMRSKPATLGDIWGQMPVFFRSYWGIYGYGILAQPWFYRVVTWMTLAGLVGLVLALILRAWGALQRRSRPDGSEGRWAGLGAAILVAAIWFVAVFASALSYMRLVRYADQGRLIFAASPAVAALLAIGWLAAWPKPVQPWLARLISLALILLAVSQVPILRDGYGLPPAVPQPLHAERPIAAEFAGGMNLVGADLPAGAGLDAGRGLPITLYMGARQPITAAYTLFMHLVDDQGQVLWQFDGVPAEGRHPTPQWVPGQVFADTHVIGPAAIPADGPGTLSIGFYPYDDPNQRQALVNPGQTGDRVTIKVRLHAQPAADRQPGAGEPLASDPLASWANGIQLAAAHVSAGSDGASRTVDLAWQSQATQQVDYTVSVQALDDQGQVVAQMDRQPQGGAFPTSTWRAGDRIPDSVTLPAVPDTWRRMIVLLYDAAGRRLPLAGAGGVADTFEIAGR
jgi:4-amino-4-deoxy-L-arabinose transferase-like glycosyltransferase